MLEHASKFSELSRFASDLVASEKLRSNRFEEGLHPKYHEKIAVRTFSTFQEIFYVPVNV